MNVQLLDLGHARVVECKSELSKVNEASHLVAACVEHRVGRVLLDAPVLPAAFFDLRTLFAGELLQKLRNYRLRAAFVVPADRNYGERFSEFLQEARRAPGSGFFTSRDEALAWLAQE